MNKQEAIEKIKNLNARETFMSEIIWVKRDDVLDIIKQLDEPEKPVVPQFVADWYEEHKDDFESNLYQLCVDYYNCKLDIEMMTWFRNKCNNPIQTVTSMHQIDYAIKEEKLYQVELPGSHKHGDIILVKDDDGDITYDVVFSDRWKERDYTKLTKDEIMKDHEWAWKYAEEV